MLASKVSCRIFALKRFVSICALSEVLVLPPELVFSDIVFEIERHRSLLFPLFVDEGALGR